MTANTANMPNMASAAGTATGFERTQRRTDLATLQHRLATPASAIVGYAAMLIDEAPAGYRETLERLRTAGADLERLIGELMLVQRKEGAHIDRDFEDFQAALRRDLATPMHVILGFCEILTSSMREDGSALESEVQRIVGATERLLAVLDEDWSEDGSDASGHGAGPGIVAHLSSAGPGAHEAWPDPMDGTVLVVDDEEMNRMLLSHYLEQRGFQVLLASDGRECLEILRLAAVDLVLLDMVMPEVDGIEVLETMRADEDLRDVPVIVVSALDELESIVRCIELGAQEYLPKTFNRTLFDARVRAVLERKRLQDRARHYVRQLSAEQERSDRLLTDILPEPVVTRLKLGETTIADSFESVTVAFLDVADFTAWSARTSPHELVSRLNALFLEFDDIASAHGVEKLKTMGDCYMMVAGVPRARDDHAEAAARACFDMLAALDRHNQAHEYKLAVRVGMHSGPVVAGVIGRSRFAYDVWGDTVNTASRMESHGVPGKVQVSEETARLLEGRFTLTPLDPIQVRGKGEMRTYLLDPPG